MKITVAKRAGFCFGVKRAVKIAFDMASLKQGVYTLGPIIHNPQVVEKLEQKGVYSIEEPSINTKSVIIRTHGIPIEMFNKVSQIGIEVIDATCPFVKKAQEYAKLLRDQGYQVIILGDKDHPEVKSIMSYAGEKVIVTRDGTELKKPNNDNENKLNKKIGIVVQTTQPVEALRKLLCNLVEKAKEMKVFNTICNSTSLRQKETSELCEKVDLMIVVGGKNSANTTQLANLCQSTGVKTYHIETKLELQENWLENVTSIGITAGASTPDWIINEIIERINFIGG
ncbi:hydroxymethylbutenyl pyrophosphate reductase [Candidatus Magnetoovum chiemensis]|nr:hydroxymethylbutenyl pyrophosphate reductase [Candidatus Magnetoovum chiemensis]